MSRSRCPVRSSTSSSSHAAGLVGAFRDANVSEGLFGPQSVSEKCYQG
jgi:hypothetical protein